MISYNPYLLSTFVLYDMRHKTYVVNVLLYFITGNLLRPWSNYNNVQLGLFLGVLTVIYKVVILNSA